MNPNASASQNVTGLARLLAIGVGGGGTNAINRMVEVGVRGVEFVAMNTDAQALQLSRAPQRIQLGQMLTRGLGAGGNPEVGRRAAEESLPQIAQTLKGADMVFITAGLGGGTGTGAGPLVALAAREQGALTVAVVTTPFGFERKRKLVAEQGLAALREVVDAVIVVSNERLTQLAGRNMGAFEAYRAADDVLRQAIQGISDLITIPGLINLDFADIRAVMTDAGSALMATGQASGENRAEDAARAALTNPLLATDIKGASGVVFNVTGGDDLTLFEVERVAELIGEATSPDANILFGAVYEPESAGTLKITLVATGFEPRVTNLRRPASSDWILARAAQMKQATAQQAAQPARPQIAQGAASAAFGSPSLQAGPARVERTAQAAPATPQRASGLGAPAQSSSMNQPHQPGQPGGGSGRVERPANGRAALAPYASYQPEERYPEDDAEPSSVQAREPRPLAPRIRRVEPVELEEDAHPTPRRGVPIITPIDQRRRERALEGGGSAGGQGEQARNEAGPAPDERQSPQPRGDQQGRRAFTPGYQGEQFAADDEDGTPETPEPASRSRWERLFQRR